MEGVMEFHDAANIFPLDDDNITALADDIRANKQQVPIELMDGKVLDGRRRWLACKMAGIKPVARVVSVDDPIAYVLSLNLYRRHLTPSQLSMVGARAREEYDKQAKERQEAAALKGNKSRAGKDSPVVENLPPPGKARDAVGKALGVSGKSIDYASRVLRQAVPEVVKAVDEGRMAVSTAAILATEPEDKQRAEATRPKRNRNYVSVTKTPEQKRRQAENQEEQDDGVIERKGVGVIRANEAINCLIRIPKNDALRKRGFQIVTDWIKANR